MKMRAVCGLLVLALGTGACAGGGEAQNTTATNAKLAAAPELTVRLRLQEQGANGHGAPAREALEQALRGAGYKLVADDEGKADVVLDLVVSAQQADKKVRIFVVHSSSSPNYRVSLRLLARSAKNAAALDEASSEYDSDDRTVDNNAVHALLAAFSSSGKLTTHAKQLKEQQYAHEAEVAQKEQDLWLASNADACKSGAQSCDGVKRYLREYPNGKFLNDAKIALEVGPEARTWVTARVDACRNPKDNYSCEGVQRYVSTYPNGLHATEATKLLAAAEKTLAAKQKAEEAQERARAAQAAAAAAARSTSSSGSGGGSSSSGSSSQPAPPPTEVVHQH
jgi:hypothetical protein